MCPRQSGCSVSSLLHMMNVARFRQHSIRARKNFSYLALFSCETILSRGLDAEPPVSAISLGYGEDCFLGQPFALCLKNLSRSRKCKFLRALAEINRGKSGVSFLLTLVIERHACPSIQKHHLTFLYRSTIADFTVPNGCPRK